ncbi:hypothetical protein M409DRAFT_68738 [Zasmidium cellare ATCC 36951]|uniref:Enoyl reductase (ER) domain-containing protein n=1 Tax=Zasmidium cellare ATCC 36951 TaxID=1080233 RepID=A0A6A6CA57_ZASCE|nr:uncharacterized protein M409DRAFT_68738 [Zasmidium cellare ATCC 36951]KAF2163118.1 hypothetical protein M409DRAFT_68738 [Zasmidium cellare ATCC 36951]
MIMPSTRNISLVFKAVPKGMPIPGEHLIIEDRPIDLEKIPENGLVVRNIYNSLDPYMRLMLVEPDTKHYRKPCTLNSPLRSLAVAEVIHSSCDDYPIGTLIRTSLPIAEYSVLSREDIDMASSSAKVKTLPSSTTLHPAYYLGPLGMPGLTAYSSLFEIGKPRPGETIFVSSAAGAVGQIVGQIARLQGLKVIGSAGSAVFNYKEESTLSALQRLAPEGIDIYFDNVGGQTLEDALACMRKHGRIIVCGMLSQYDSTSSTDTSQSSYGVKNLFRLFSQGLTMRGFQVGMRDFGPKYEEDFERDMGFWIGEGKIKAVVSEVTGIERGAEGFVGMLKGDGFGKACLRVEGSGVGGGDGRELFRRI